MSHTHSHQRKPFPKGVLYAAASLVFVTLALVTVAQTTGYGKVVMPEADPVQTMTLSFVDRADGAVVAYGEQGQVVRVFDGAADGFVRGVLRSMFRTRKLEGVERDRSFQLVRWSDGQLSLGDPSTGRRVYLTAFGTTNLEAFARLLQPRPAEQAMREVQP